MPSKMAQPFRFLVGDDPFIAPERLGEFAARLLSHSDILRYARALQSTACPELSFYLEVPGLPHLARIRLSDRSTARTRRTAVHAEPAGRLDFDLTPRELQVLTLLAAGLPNAAIAARLGSSPRTVSTQVERLRAKLGATTRTAAGVIAASRGTLRLPLPAPLAELSALTVAALQAPPEGPAAATTTRPRAAGPRALSRATPASLPAASGATALGATALGTAPRGEPPLRIALAYPLSGEASADGAQSRNGAQLAIEEINRGGGALGRLLEAVVVDADVYSAEGIDRTFQTLEALDPDAVLMGYAVDQEAALNAARSLNCPLLHTMTTQRHVDAQSELPAAAGHVFQAVPTELNYGSGLLRFLAMAKRHFPGAQGTRRVEFIHTGADAGRIDSPALLAAMEQEGWTPAASERMPATAAARSRLARQVASRAPAVVVVTEFSPRALADFQVAFAAAAPASLLFAVYAPSVPEFERLAGAAARGLVWSTVSGTYNDPLALAFSRRFRQRFGTAPGRSQAGLGHDMVQLLAQAWRRSGESKDLEATVAALAESRYRGVNGGYDFSGVGRTSLSYPDQTSDPSLGHAQMMWQIGMGRHICLDPPAFAEGDLVLPPWFGSLSPAPNTSVEAEAGASAVGEPGTDATADAYVI